MNFAERAGRNEEVVRDVNEKIEEGAEMHGVTSPMPFHCECAQTACMEKIDLFPSDYERILCERYRFAVVPDHVQSEFERVVEDHGDFIVVEKIGDAREQIDEDHPQQHHRDPSNSSP